MTIGLNVGAGLAEQGHEDLNLSHWRVDAIIFWDRCCACWAPSLLPPELTLSACRSLAPLGGEQWCWAPSRRQPHERRLAHAGFQT